MYATFNPISGEGSVGERTKVCISGCPCGEVQWLPNQMLDHPFVKKLRKQGWDGLQKKIGCSEELFVRTYLKVRSLYDFPFWAYMFVKIKNKAGGDDIKFRLNRPQRKLTAKLEKMRIEGKPIRLVLLKARQWGGSTCTQMYMAWIQLVHKKSWNSLIASHTNSVSATVRGMYTKMLETYPTWMLYPLGESYDENCEKLTNFEGQTNIKFQPARQCKIRIATAQAQENLRSEDVAMCHLTEVALYPDTTQLHPQDFVVAFTSGMATGAYSLKVMESTAKGSGNFFHTEWLDAYYGRSDSEALFVGWQDIERDQLAFESDEEKRNFAQWLIDNRYQKEAPDRRSYSGEYLFRVWTQSEPTLEGMHWYVEDRKRVTSNDAHASEAPSFWQEAFSATGEELFDAEVVEKLRAGCKQPRWIGEVQGDTNKGAGVLRNIRFIEDKRGELWVWSKPETFEGERIENRYVVVVDIGGTHHAADWSVILVIDRYWMMEGGKPTVVAQWYGHIDHDLLAWKAAQIAKWYNDALLVVESNTLDKERDVNADVSEFILNRVKNVYDNLYERERSEEDIANNKPSKYGWHTNRATKPKIIKGLQECVRDQMYAERDERCLDEYKVYEHNGQKYEAKQGYHDDLLMTRAIGLWICFNEMGEVRSVPIHKSNDGEIQTDIAIL